ncbi:MAG: 50S ribosomal protein L21 [Chloroflexota bacterium]
MYAVIETGGKQYRVEVGTELQVELLDATPGDTLKLERVLLVADGETASIGRPLVSNASVSAEVLRRDRGDKVISFKYQPKARRRVKKGHRQELTVLRISDIVLDGKSAAKDAAKAAEDAKTERQRLEEAAARQAAADAALAEKLAVGAEADTKPATAESKPATSKPARAKASSAKGKAKAEPSVEGGSSEGVAATEAEPKKATSRKTSPTPTAEATDAPAGSPETPKRRQTKKDE